MSFSSRRRNYLLAPHRRDGLIEWMKSMLMHSFVLDALESTAGDTFSHFEMLIQEHRRATSDQPSRLKQLVPTVGTFHTRLPLKRAYEAYNAKYRISSRKFVCISFNEIRHILNLAQIMALHNPDLEERDKNKINDGVRHSESQDEDKLAAIRYSMTAMESPGFLPKLAPSDLLIPSLSLDGSASSNDLLSEQKDDHQPKVFQGAKLITFDGDQTLYSDGANFESNPKLASYLYLLLKHGVTIAVVTAAGYEYQTSKYELRLSGLLRFFRENKLSVEDCSRFYLFGGECNYLLNLGSDYKLHPVREYGPGGWITSTSHIPDTPANWNNIAITKLLDKSQDVFEQSLKQQNMRARVIRKKRSVGLVPSGGDTKIPREALDETAIRAQNVLANENIPFCAFNGGRDCWVDVGNKRVGVLILQHYLGISPSHTLHIGDQFLNTGNDFAARDVCPCVWITSPEETTYLLKYMLRLADISFEQKKQDILMDDDIITQPATVEEKKKENDTNKIKVDFEDVDRRMSTLKVMDIYTGEMISTKK